MSYTLYRPETVAEAIAIQARTGGSYLAGGTVTMVDLHRGKEIDTLISLDRLTALREIILEEDSLCIGAGVTMDDLENSINVKTFAHALWQAACEVGGPQIRNRATLGGNLAAASPSSDCAVPLLAMDAKLRVCGLAGERTIALREFFLGRFRHTLKPDEIIVSIEIPACTASAFRKVGKRNALAVSCLNMAVVRRAGETSVAVGAAAPKPLYLPETSRLLSAGDFNAAFAALQREISPIDDRWATASYRRTVSERLLRALAEETEA